MSGLNTPAPHSTRAGGGRLSLISVGLWSRALKTKKKIGAVPMRGRLCLRGVSPQTPWPVDEPGRIGRAGVGAP